jgi:hypothetical protein
MRSANRLALVLLSATAACVSTQTTAMKSTRFEGVSFKGVAVKVNAGDLAKRQSLEDQTVTALQTKGIHAASAMRLLPPVDTFTAEEIDDVLARHDIDTVLRVNITGEGANDYGFMGSSNGALTFDAQLVERSTDKTIWSAQIQSNNSGVGWGAIFTNKGDIAQHTVSDLAVQLQNAGLFKQPNPDPQLQAKRQGL